MPNPIFQPLAGVNFGPWHYLLTSLTVSHLKPKLDLNKTAGNAVDLKNEVSPHIAGVCCLCATALPVPEIPRDEIVFKFGWKNDLACADLEDTAAPNIAVDQTWLAMSLFKWVSSWKFAIMLVDSVWFRIRFRLCLIWIQGYLQICLRHFGSSL